MSAPGHVLLQPRVAISFLVISLVWGSTWVVIAQQISQAPPAWAVVWRFLPATCGAFILALAGRHSLLVPGRVHLLATGIGLTQFCGNYVLVYNAEQHLTSGIVAVMISLLIIPNAVLGRIMLGDRLTAGFLGGTAIAIAGIALLLVNEVQSAQLGRNVPLGIVLALGAMLAASVASVIQANDTGRSVPLVSLLAWAMLYGTLLDAAFAWAMHGPPVLPPDLTTWAGALYLAIFGSVLTFPLYWGLVREIGAGRAAYQGILVVIIAMALSTVFEGYRWSWLALSGAALSLAGLVIALRARNPDA